MTRVNNVSNQPSLNGFIDYLMKVEDHPTASVSEKAVGIVGRGALGGIVGITSPFWGLPLLLAKCAPYGGEIKKTTIPPNSADTDYIKTFSVGTPIYKLYERLKMDGVKDADLDQGFESIPFLVEIRTAVSPLG